MGKRIHKGCGGTVVESYNFHKANGELIWYMCLTCGKEFKFGEDEGEVEESTILNSFIRRIRGT